MKSNKKTGGLTNTLRAFILFCMAAKKLSTKSPVQALLSRVKQIKLRQPKSYTPILIGLLIIAAFLVGQLYTKVQYLEQNGGSGVAAGTQQAAAGQQGAQQQQAAAQPVKNLSLGHFPALGNKNAKVQIVEFADLRCPFCEQFFTQTEPQIIKNYVDTGKATFSFRQYAFLGPSSTVAANAAECANEQGKFWAFHDYMYQHQPAETDTSMYTTDNLTTIAGQLGMDTAAFNSCLSSNKDAALAQKDFTEGQTAGVSGTPTIFIDGIPVVGAQPYSAFQTLIDQELAKK